MSPKKLPLNELQSQAVNNIYGPVLVMAGPGTGKTQMLTRRIEHLLASDAGAEPENILCLTFTESGAVEMRNRLAKWIKGDAYKVKISTFHGFCQWIMDEYEEIFLPKVRGKIIADDLQKALIFQKVIKSKKWEYFSSPWDDFAHKFDILKTISDAKKEYLNPQKLRELLPAEKERLEADPKNFYTRKYKTFAAGDWKPAPKQKIEKKIGKLKELAEFWEKLDAQFDADGFFDFDDQIDWVVEELQSNESLRFDLQEQFQWMMVDEYQDSNTAQTEILWALCDGLDEPNLFVVGDADQSIYKFQGASSANVTDFLKKFPTTLQITLEENYRSQQNILDSAYASVLQNNERVSKNNGLVSRHPRFKDSNDGQIFQTVFSSRQAEICALAQKIQQKIAAGMSPNEIAILVRKNREIAELARELPKFNIPVSAQVFQNVFENESVQYLILLLEIFKSKNLDANDKIFEVLHAPFWNIEPAQLLEFSLHRNRTRQTFSQILQSEIFYGNFERKINIEEEKFLIRRMVNRDEILAQFADLKKLWEAEMGGNLPPESDDENLQTSFFFVIEKNGKTVGFSRGRMKDSVAELDATILQKEFRGKGLGGKLLQTIENFLATQQIIKWGLLAQPKAKNLYKTFGFEDSKPLNKNAERVFAANKNLIPLAKKINQSPTHQFSMSYELQDFFKFLLQARQNFWHLRPAVIAEKLLYESGLADWMTKEKKLEDWQNVRKFLDWIREQNQTDLSEILSFIDLHKELGIGLNPDPLPGDKKSVKIMTTHKSKGMEFEIVFVPGLIDKTWGNPRNMTKIALPQLSEKVADDENEEERRLFFVALTRAKAEIYLSMAETDFSGRAKSPSIFWHEIPAENITEIETKTAENELSEFLPILTSEKPVMLTNQEKSRLQEIVKNYVWSASSLNNYLECPRRFLFQNLYKFPRRPMPAMAMGTALHQAIEKFFRAETWNEAKILQEYERALRGQNLPKDDFEKLLDHGNSVLKKYHAEKLVDFAAKYPHGFELEYDFRPFGPSVDGIRLTGKMDKIEFLNEQKNEVKIVDYKSGRPKAVKFGERLWRQLVFYDLLCRAAQPNWIIQSCELDFLTADAKDVLGTRAYEVSESDRQHVLDELKTAHENLQNLKFPTVPNPTVDEDIEYWQSFGK